MIQSKGNCSYDIELFDDRIVRCHGDHVRIRTIKVDQTPDLTTDTDDPLMDPGVPSMQHYDKPPDAAHVP